MAFLLALLAAAFALFSPDRAAAQGGTCAFNFGTVAYGSTGNTYTMAGGSPEQLACDRLYPAPDSGVAIPKNGTSTGGGTWTGVTELTYNAITYTPHPSFRGTDTFTMWFCDDPGCSGAGRLTATVTVQVSSPIVTLTPVSGALPGGAVSVPYSQTLSAAGGTSPHSFTVVSGNLPPGLSLGTVTPGQPSTVQLSGTPTGGGNFSFTIRAEDSSTGAGPVTVDQSYTIAVAAPSIGVNPASISNGTEGSAYGPVTLTASGGTAPYSFSVSPGTLPTGMTLSPGGVLSGTPTQSGTFNFTARAQDSSTGTGPYNGTRPYTFTIAAVSPVANPVSATVAYGSSNNPITLNITSGSPTSVAVATQATHGTATATGLSISYTPTPGYAGPDTFTYTATNAGGTSAPATVTITVSPPTVAVNPASLPDGAMGVAYSQTVTASGGTGPYTYSVSPGTLPTGLSIDPSSGVISGTPTGSGTSSFTVRASDSSTGPSSPFVGTRNYSITVIAPPVANPVGVTVAHNSSNNPVTLSITGGTPTGVAVASPASNGTASAAGLSITYTPTAGYAGPDSFTYTATNTAGTSTAATVTITVNPPPPPVANPVSSTVSQNSSNNPITLNIVGGTPSSVAVAAPASHGTATATGLSITYTPTAGYAGPDSFTYTATNAGGTSAPATVTITVNQPTVVVNPASLSNGVIGAAYSQTVTASGGTGPYTYSVSLGSLPAGLSIDPSSGLISGTPTGSGSLFAVRASDSSTGPGSPFVGTRHYTVNIVPPSPPVANAVSATVGYGTSNNPIPLNITGGPPSSVAVATQATNGTATAAGLSITYTPTAGYAGSDSFTYTATNPGGTSTAATVTITVGPPTIAVNPGSLPNGMTGFTYNQTVTASGGAAPYTYSISPGTLPSGLSIDPNSGVISGTPTGSGASTFTVRASDSSTGSASPFVGTHDYTINIAVPNPPVANPVSATVAHNSSNNPITLNITGGTPTSVAVASPASHGTATATGLSIRYTPTVGYAGSDSFTYTAANADGTSAAATVTITVGQSASSVALVSSSNPSLFGHAVTFTATVTGTSPTGSVTFKDGATTLGTGTVSGGVATFTTSALLAGARAITAIYGGDTANVGATSTVLTQSVNQSATTTTISSSVNPSAPGQAVTFTASVTSTGGTPTGSVTFNNGGVAIGAATLASGVASFTTTALAVGTHSITASYGSTAGFAASTSSMLTQTVAIPADSIKLRQMQVAVTKVIAQNSGQAISGAIDSAISDGFGDGGSLVVPSGTGLRFNFSADPDRGAADAESTVSERWNGMFGRDGTAPGGVASAYASGRRNASRVDDAFAAINRNAAPAKAPSLIRAPKEWMLWADVRGSGIDRWGSTMGSTQAPLHGAQVNALLGLTHKLGPNVLVGAFGGYETFDYTSSDINGKLKGDGWTVGTYLGWKLSPTIRFDAAMAYSGLGYDGIAGTAQGNFDGRRWLVSSGLTGTYKAYGFDIEPSAKVYALWEHQNAYTDSLGTRQDPRNFATGRASGGVKLSYPLAWTETVALAPYAGLYGDFYFNRDDAAAIAAAGAVPLASFPLLEGWSARATAGLAARLTGGSAVAVGGELGGIGSDFRIWTFRARANFPF